MSTPTLRHFRVRAWLPFVVILAVGFVAIVVTVNDADRQAREELRSHAQTIAGAIEAEDMEGLTGTVTDLDTARYRALKARIVDIRRATPSMRFVYVMGERDGAVVFFVDSEPADSADSSAPGDVYDEASDALRAHFASREAFVEGPETDRWGTWVSGFAPLVHGDAHAPMMVGVDIDASDWHRNILERALLPLALMLMTIVVFVAYRVVRVREAGFVRRLAAQEAKLRRILDRLPVGVAVADAPSGVIRMMNKAGVALLGRDPSASTTSDKYADYYAITRQDGTPYPPEHLPLPTTLRTGRKVTKDDMLIHNPKLAAPIVLRATSAMIDSDPPVGVAVFEDITREREVEKMKTEFVSVASHQLRTPLTGIKWFCELLLGDKAGKLADEQRDFIAQVAASNDRMIRLVEDLLNVSRIETGRKFAIEKQPVDLATIVRSVVDEHLPVAEKRHQRIACTAPSTATASVDEQKMRQVLGNLVSNALKYSPDGAVVDLVLKTSVRSGVTITVTDKGIGIPAAQQSRIFEKFFRAENAATQQANGTGLGLYIAKAIVEGHDGTLTFISKEGKGTTFTVRLPLVCVR